MTDVNIKSENQSGGITAQNVSTGSSEQLNITKQTNNESKWKTIFWWIFGIVGCIGVGIAIYTNLF
jgi:hypothetical protein